MKVKNNESTPTYAQWVSRQHYDITFTAGTGGQFDPIILDMYDGEMLTLDRIPSAVSEPHYAFTRWEPEVVEHPITQVETYTSVHEYIAATVHFNTGENGESIPDMEVDRGAGITINNPRHRSGIFVGWYSDSGLQNAVDLSTWKMPSPAVETTFYAKWDLNAAKAIVSFDITGGTVKYPSLVKVLQKDGWADVNGTATLTAEEVEVTVSDEYDASRVTWTPSKPEAGTVITGNITYTAVYKKKPMYTVTTNLGQNLRFISGKEQTQVMVGRSFSIEIGPASNLYRIGDQDWRDKIVVTPNSGVQIDVKPGSHVPPQPTAFTSTKAINFTIVY